ncbi:MAG TPA: histidine kinase [Terracidiphilus sp.]|nr:histidine kinase [Terracidiphilus sp.]
MNRSEASDKCDTAIESNSLAGFRSYLLRMLWIVPAATVAIALLFYLLGHLNLSRAAQHILAIFVYSACIAIPSMVLVTFVSVRYTARIPRAIVLVQAVCLVCTATGGSLLADLIIWIIGIGPRDYWAEFRTSAPFSVFISLAIGLAFSTYETLQGKLKTTELELRTRQVEQERANKLLAEARLSSLESSIHPHFLFNTLNTIAALIPSNPQLAEDTVGKLASLLRFSLNAQHGGLVPFAQELKVVRDYIEIESTRFGPRLRYHIAAPASLDSIKVPPLSLQTLVENAVKHVAAQRIEGASIEVSGSMEDGRIRLEVADNGPGFSLDGLSPGHGLDNLIGRLKLLFGEDGSLDVIREPEKTRVRISFPAES